jgi:flavin reductase (DIM6/NTAB) family NADH-FMN oxidoreductase RutF
VLNIECRVVDTRGVNRYGLFVLEVVAGETIRVSSKMK